MDSIKFIKSIGIFLGSIVMATGLWGCQTGGFPTHPVAPDRQISLIDGGPHNGKEDTNGAVLEYQYTIQSAQPQKVVLAIEGELLSAPAEASQIRIYVLALDGQGKVLAKKILYASGNNATRYAIKKTTFNSSYKLPSETKAMAFDSYIQLRSGER
jgi:hypothetical protein